MTQWSELQSYTELYNSFFEQLYFFFGTAQLKENPETFPDGSDADS